MIKTRIKIIALLLGVIAMQAQAGGVPYTGGTSTTTMQASTTLSSTCTVAASNILFGAVTPAATGIKTAFTTLTSTCTKGTSYTMALSDGSGTIAERSMAGATSGNTDKLLYNVYTDTARTTIFGNGTTGNIISSSGTGASTTVRVYGSLNLNQYLVPDTYSDSLTVTLSY